MGRMARICLQSFLKLVNSVIGMVGIGMILYAMWMLRVWYKQMNGDWRGPDSSAPWFIYTFLDVFLNRNWEEDFPEDPTGRFDELKDFVRSNFEMCKWIGLMIVSAQALSILLAIVLRALGPDRERDYDSDDDYIPTRLPLLRNHQNPSYADPHAKTENWSLKINEKTNRYAEFEDFVTGHAVDGRYVSTSASMRNVMLLLIPSLGGFKSFRSAC